jgi:hypothetical protein
MDLADALTESPQARFRALKAGLDVRAGGAIVPSGGSTVSTGLPDLDAILGGGFPRGAISTLEGAGSCGRRAICARFLAGVTSRGLAAVVDDGTLYPPDLARAGVRLERLLIVPHSEAPSAAKSAVSVARAADIVLRSRAFAAVVIPGVALKATVWSRLAGLAHKAESLLIVTPVQATTELAYFATTRVRCSLDRALWSASAGIFLKHRRAAPGAFARLRIVEASERTGEPAQSAHHTQAVREAVS